MELLINGSANVMTNAHRLDQQLEEAARASQFIEVWLRGKYEWPAICGLINGDAAWLMFMSFEGDAGFYTQNPEYSGPPTEVIAYQLSNGQRDEYPASWNISTTEAVRALKYFFAEETMAPWLHWKKS
jgi:hypothetical protein